MSWHFVERWLQKVNQHSTLVGKFWITFLIVFRIVVVSSVGDRVYADEQSEFKCNTQEVGCPNVCFNKFSPVSHIRFWSFQIILVTAPSIAFIIYSAHQVKKKTPPTTKHKANESGHVTSHTKKSNLSKDVDKKRKLSKLQGSNPNEVAFNQDDSELRRTVVKELFGDDRSAIAQHYVLYALSVILRTGIEVVFMYLQYTLFGFWIVELYKCKVFPCPNTVDCFVSRPMEKTIFLWFMFVITGICLLLNALELQYLFMKLVVKKRTLIQKQQLKYCNPNASVKNSNLEVANHYQRPSSGLQRPYSTFHLPSAPPVYGKIANLPENQPQTSQLLQNEAEPIVMSFSMNDAALLPPDEVPATSKHLVSVMSVTNDQPYLAHPRVNSTSRQKGYNNYV